MARASRAHVSARVHRFDGLLRDRLLVRSRVCRFPLVEERGVRRPSRVTRRLITRSFLLRGAVHRDVSLRAEGVVVIVLINGGRVFNVAVTVGGCVIDCARGP